jgi:D-alanyl-D-alanine carboxypeptidase
MAHGYEEYMGMTYDTVDWPTSYGWAAGGMVSSLRDLTRWAEALYEGEVLAAGSLEAMLTPWIPYSEESGTAYGLGATILETPFGPAFGHGGGIYGYRTHMEHIPNADVTVIALVTTIGGDVTTLADLGYEAALGTKLYD